MNLSLKEIRTPVALVGLVLATRFHHFGDVLSLPDASLAAFFLAGLWVRSWKFFVLLLLQAGLIDYVSITAFSVSDYCISPAYLFLIPTYACLWFSGHYCARYKTLNLSGVSVQFVLLLLATSVAFAISNGSFYLLSGKFPDLNLVEYASRVAQYYPPYLTYTLSYAVIIFSMVKIMNVIFSNSVNSDVSQGQ